MKKIIAFSGLALTLMFAASPKAEAQISKQGKGAIIGGAGGAAYRYGNYHNDRFTCG